VATAGPRIVGAIMTHSVRHVVLKIASRCNLNCGYCYLYNHEDQSALRQPKRISDKVFQKIVSRMKEYTDQEQTAIGLTFHGGEPMLLQAERFAELISYARKQLGSALESVSIQTNGTLVTDRWAQILRDENVGVGVSLDGPPEVHDPARPLHSGRGSHALTLKGIRTLQKHGVDPKILCVVNPENNGLDTYNHFRNVGLKSFEFLMPDVSHDNKELFYGAGAHPVYDFLSPILDAWMAENNSDIVIPLFSELLRSLMSGQPVRSECFGNAAMNYIVVNTDGTIEPLDALKVCRDGLTDVDRTVFKDGFSDLGTGDDFLSQCLTGHQGLPTKCAQCVWKNLCGGGYLPHRYSRDNGFDNPSVWCADIQLLLAKLANIIEPASIPIPQFNNMGSVHEVHHV
jgi:uncharacterized protein